MFLDEELWGLLLLCFLSATILPFPSEAAVLFLLSTDQYSDLSILTIASLGNCLGGYTTYFIGYWTNQLVKKGKWFSKLERLTFRFGSWMALFSWVPFIGDPLLTLLGFLKSKPFPTLLFMSIGKISRYLMLYWIYLSAI